MPLPAPHPEWEMLVKQRDALHSQIAGILTDLHEIDDSRHVVLGRYSAAFGDRLAKLHALDIEAARLKREIELVQASLNRGGEIDYGTIQAALEMEFAEWQAKLEVEAQKLAAQRDILNHLLDPAQDKAMRDLFRKLARRLHPDLHPEQSSSQAELWHRVIAAYDMRDLDDLEALEILTRDAAEVLTPDSLTTLRESIEPLRAKLDKLLHKVAEIRKQWPFDQLVVLDDAIAIIAKQAELDERIATAEALRDERKHWLNLLLDH